MALPERLGPVLLTVGDPCPGDDWDFTVESLIGMIELSGPVVDLVPLIAPPTRDGWGIFERRTNLVEPDDYTIDGDCVTIETCDLYANVMASDVSRQVGGAYRYRITLRGDDPAKTRWVYDFRFIIDGDATYDTVDGAITVGQISTLDPPDPLNPEFVALQSAVATLESQVGSLVAGGDQFETQDFTNEQVWTMNHTMGRQPAVHTIDDTGDEVHSTVEYPTATRVDVTHSVPRSGTMILT